MFDFIKKNKKNSTNPNNDRSQEILKINFSRAIDMIKSGNKNGFEVLEMSAEDGYSEAQFLYAKMLENGSDQPHQSFNWYKKASEQGHHEAQRCLADLYMVGNFTEKNEVIALGWYKKSADGGVAEAQFVLGEFYRSGSFVDKDLKVAEEWYKKSAQQYYEPASERLKQMKVNSNLNLNLNRSDKTGVFIYDDPFAQAPAEQLFSTGLEYFIGDRIPKNWELAAKYIEAAAEKGLIVAQTNIGLMYKAGQGVKRDVDKSFYWFSKAAENGDAESYWWLGVMYDNGASVPVDKAKSLVLIKKSAQSGYIRAQQYLKSKGIKC